MGDERVLAEVIDSLPLGVWIARAPGGELFFANRTFREIMGTEARDDVVVGGYAQPYGICGPDGRAYPEDRLPFVLALRARAIVTVDDIVIHRHDGRRVNIRATARPVFEGDTITQVVICFVDCTAEKQAERAREESDARLRQAQRLESLGTLAAGVAHDFNNLLGTISLIASMLGLREPDRARAEDLRRIIATTESAARLTRSLLAFGRQGPLRAVRFDAGEVAANVIELIRRTFDRNVEIVFVRDGASSIVGDPTAIEQMLMNLAFNARDAMPEGGRLSVRFAREGDRVVIEVGDTGAGVPRELRGRIFEPYFTTKGDRELTGRGLGLATVYGIVEAHAGTIEVRDASPHGAVFRVTIPAAIDQSEAAAPPARPDEATVRGHGTVLVVDDEPLVRASLRRALEDLGYDAREAPDGVAALEQLGSGDVHAVLLDSVMPRKGGRDTLIEVRRRPAPPPVIMMGGRIVPSERQELFALGAIAVLDKPFDVPALSRILADVIRPT
jgi:two-component system cell cycle sensor histidine kinase/response regulator CckA